MQTIEGTPLTGQSQHSNLSHSDALAAYYDAAEHGTLHASHHVESMTISGAVTYGAMLSTGLFAFLGFLIGYNRAPGSFYTYGLGCFVWPMISMIALGAIVGAALGFTFGSISHGSDPTTSQAETVEPEISKAPTRRSMTTHMTQH